jgi:hypothetical protein
MRYKFLILDTCYPGTCIYGSKAVKIRGYFYIIIIMIIIIMAWGGVVV